MLYILPSCAFTKNMVHLLTGAQLPFFSLLFLLAKTWDVLMSRKNTWQENIDDFFVETHTRNFAMELGNSGDGPAP